MESAGSYERSEITKERMTTRSKVKGYQVDDFDTFYFGHIAFNGSLYASLERHGRHAAVTTIANEFKADDALRRDLVDFYVATIGQQIRPDGIQRGLNLLGQFLQIHRIRAHYTFNSPFCVLAKLAFLIAI